MQEQNVNEKEPMNDIKFADGSVPVAVAARVYGKEAHWVRAGIIVGWLPIGTATRKGQVVKTIKEMDSRYDRINYYISPNETVEKRLYYRERMDVVNKATQDADTELASYIFKAVTQGLSYEALRLQMNMPCSRDIYYDRYRRFFYLLSKYRR